jgi:asparagine synthase (glutamine-hydrolysing)
LSAEWSGYVEEAERRGEVHRCGHPLTAALHRDIPWRLYGTRSIEQSQVNLRSPFMDNELTEMAYEIPNTLRQSATVQQTVIHNLHAPLARIMSDRGHASGWNPFVQSAVRTFLWAIFKADYLYYFDTPGWLLKCETPMRVLGVPRYMLGYQKFEHYRVWYRDNLSSYIADILLDPRTLQRPFIDGKKLKKAVQEHIAGTANHYNLLERALTFEHIFRTLIESIPTEFNAASVSIQNGKAAELVSHSKGL